MEEKVYFDGICAGIIKEEVSGEISFTYDAQYLSNTAYPPISVNLPKRSEPYKAEGLLPFFDGLIPEGWLLTLAADRYKLNPYRDRFALLLSTCQDTIGAVTIGATEGKREKPEKHWDHQSLNERLSELGKKFDRCLYCYGQLSKTTERLYHKKCSIEMFGTEAPPVLDFSEEQIKDLGIQTVNEKLAVPGVQKKISLSLDEESGENGAKAYRMTVANLWARYILKPKGREPHTPENEHLTLLMAKTAGIRIAQSGLIPLSSGELAFISERFDRPRGQAQKFHMEDFCQILEKRPEQKYIGSIEQVAKRLREITAENSPEDNVLRLFELVVFSFLTGNSDLHLKNLSVLWSPKPALAPAYDLLCMDIWITDDDQSALSMVGKKNKLTAKDFEALYQHIGIKEKVAQNIYKQMARNVDAWKELIDLSYLEPEFKQKYKSLLDHRASILLS